jgi:SAM-dependent methyltransferase
MADQPVKPLALDAYETLAERYAARIDTKAHNAYYERPAMLALLPEPINELRILDAGCGPGWYADWFLARGADVTGVDVSPKMIELARQRTGGRGTFHVADLGQRLDFLTDHTFDLVFSALALHYIPDWRTPLGEFHRVLRPGGLLIFSTDHPCAAMEFSQSGNYFEHEEIGMFWRSFGGEPVYVPWYRYPLGAITGWLWESGFVIERLVEPRPVPEFAQDEPEHYEEYQRTPGFMCIRARKDSNNERAARQ